MKQMPQPFIIPRTASPLSTGIDAASQALAMWAAKSQKDKEQEAALPGLVSFINGLDDKSKATVMSKLIAEQPELAQKVSAKITPPSPSTQDQMSEIWRQVSTGFHPGETFDGSVNMQRASAPPPPPPPMGMIGRPSLGNALGVTPQTAAAAMPSTYDPNKSVPGPAPAGFDPLPSEPYARALMLTNRNLNTYGEKVLSSPEYLKMVSGAALPSDKQLPAALTAYDLAPKADVTTTQAAENARNATTNATTRRGQDMSLQAAGLRAASGGANSEQANEIADAIVRGEQPPDVKGLYRLAGPVRAALADRGYNMTKANLDWQATQKHVATLNGPQQTRLRQAVDAATGQLDNVEKLYDEWKRVGAVSGIKVFNRAALAAAKNLPGEAGAAAQALEGQIALATGEFGQVLMGGNSPTDHSLALSAKMLQGDWNEETFKRALTNLRTDFTIRSNSLANSMPAGTSAANPYSPNTATGDKTLDADTAKKFLTQAGGDKNKARDLARAAGYKF